MPTLNKKGRELPRPRDKLNKQQHPQPRHTHLPGVLLGRGLRGRERERTRQPENRNMSSRPETSLMAPVWGRGPREPPESLLDGRDEARGPSPKPQVSTTTARTSDLRADQGWLPAGCAAASHPGPEVPHRLCRGGRGSPQPRASRHSPVEAEAPRKPPTDRWRGRVERGSGRGTRALPSPNPPARCSRSQQCRVQPPPAPCEASVHQEFEGKLARVTSGAGGGLGDFGARGATPRERGRRAACARRARNGRGRRRRGTGAGCACAVLVAASLRGWDDCWDSKGLSKYHIAYLTFPKYLLIFPPI